MQDKMDVETHVVDGGQIVSGYTSADGLAVLRVVGQPTSAGWRTFLGEMRELWPVRVDASLSATLVGLGFGSEMFRA